MSGDGTAGIALATAGDGGDGGQPLGPTSPSVVASTSAAAAERDSGTGGRSITPDPSGPLLQFTPEFFLKMTG